MFNAPSSTSRQDIPIYHHLALISIFPADVDECAVATDNNCDAHADCTNIAGSFTCACSVGFEGDGVTCTGTGACSFQDGFIDKTTHFWEVMKLRYEQTSLVSRGVMI